MSIGLDIGTKGVKIVELEKSGDKFRLRASGIVGYEGRLPDQITEERDLSILAATIRKLHKESKVSDKKVKIALPEYSVYTRTITFPALTDSEVSSAVRWEADQYIPIPVSEAIIQHQILERREKESPPGVLVSLVAAPKKIVEKFVKVVQMAGLGVISVETSLMSLARVFSSQNQVVLAVNIGANSTDMAVTKNGQVFFSRSIPTGGEAFTRSISSSLSIDKNQAEEYKKTYGLRSDQLEGKVETAMEPVVRVIVDEIKKATHFYETDIGGQSPSSVVLSGGSSAMPELASSFTKLIGIEVIIGNSFARVEADPKTLSTLASYSPMYSVAVGLAMRED